MGMETKQEAMLICEEVSSKRKMNFTFSVPKVSNGMVKRIFPLFFTAIQDP